MRRVYRREKTFYHKRWTRRKKIFVLLFSFFLFDKLIIHIIYTFSIRLIINETCGREQVKSISLYMMNEAILQMILSINGSG